MNVLIAVAVGVTVLFIVFAVYIFWPRPFPSSGTIIEKTHEKERTWTQLIPIYIGKVMVLFPFIHFDDEDWIITVEDSNGLRGDIYLTKTTWQKLQVGEHYIVTKDDDLADEVEKTEE